MSSRTAPRPPRYSLTQSTQARTSSAASAGAADRPTRRAPADPAGRRPCRRPAASSSPASRRIRSYSLHFRHALRPRCGCRAVRRAGPSTPDPRGQQPDREPGAQGPDDRGAVTDVKGLRLGAIAVHQDVPSVSTPSRRQKQPDTRGRSLSRQATSDSEHLRPPQVVEVHDSLDGPLLVDDDDRRDLVRLHDPERFDREHSRGMVPGGVITSPAVSVSTSCVAS